MILLWAAAYGLYQIWWVIAILLIFYTAGKLWGRLHG